MEEGRDENEGPRFASRQASTSPPRTPRPDLVSGVLAADQSYVTGNLKFLPKSPSGSCHSRTTMNTHTLAVSSTFVDSSRPLVSISLPQNAYVIALAPAQDCYAAAASLPTSSIHLLDKTAPSTLLRSLPGHQGGISALISAQTFGNASLASLVSCGRDGQVISWDERSGEAAIQSEHLPSTHTCLFGLIDGRKYFHP